MNSFVIRAYQEKCRLLRNTGPRFCPCGCGQRYNPQTQEVWVELDQPDPELLERIREVMEQEEEDEDDERDDMVGEESEVDANDDYVESGMWREDLYDEEIRQFGHEEQDEEDREYDYYEDGIFEDDLYDQHEGDVVQGESLGGWGSASDGGSANISPGWGIVAREDVDDTEHDGAHDVALEDEADNDGDQSEESDSDSDDLSDEGSDGEEEC